MCRNFIGAFAALAMIAAQAVAQNATQPREPGVQPRPAARPGAATGATSGAPQGALTSVDHAIAACLLLGNQEEVAMAQFAQKHAKSGEVKEFARMMDEEHRQAIAKLQQLAPQLASFGEELQTSRDGQAAQGARPRSPAGGGDEALMTQMMALHQRVAQECLTLTQKELGAKEGSEFDRCYIGQQMGAHLAMLAKLKGSDEFASPQLQAFIQEATKTVQNHFDHTKKIAKTLEAEAVQSAQRTGQPRR